MYNPPAFNDQDFASFLPLIETYPLATWVTTGRDGIEANHLPSLLVRSDEKPLGTLYAHISKANFIWKTTKPSAEALVIFQGPQGYISPNWYPSKESNPNVVPTWNYVALHLYGRLRFFHEAEKIRWLIEQLTQTHENPNPHPWSIDDAEPSFVEGQIRGIIGLELDILRFQGKRKLSQNRLLEDHASVVQHLSANNPDLAAATQIELEKRRDS